MPGIESQIMPKIGSQPSQLGQAIPGGAPQTFGDLVQSGGMSRAQPGGAQSFGDLMNQGAQATPVQAPPQAAPTPTPQQPPDAEAALEQKEKEALLSQLSAEAPHGEKKDAEESEKKALLDQFNGITKEIGESPPDPSQFDPNGAVVDWAKKPGESGLQYMKRYTWETMKHIAEENRRNISGNKDEETRAAQSMYGADNVKMYRGKMYFRPDMDSKFRPLDQKDFDFISDFLYKHVLSVPGLAANAATTAAVETGAGVGTGGPGAIPAAAGALAMGGAAQGVTDFGVKKLVDSMSSIPQNQSSPKDQVSDLGMSIAKDSGINLAFGLGTKALQAGGEMVADTGVGKFAISRLKALVKSPDMISPAAPDLIGGAMSENPLVTPGTASSNKDALNKAAAIRLEYENLTNNITQVTRLQSGTGLQASAGEQAGNAIDARVMQLEKQVRLVRDKSIGLAKESGVTAAPDTYMQKLKDVLNDHGVQFDRNGYAIDLNKTDNSAFKPLDLTGNQATQEALDQTAKYAGTSYYREPFGAPKSGRRALQDMVERYNSASALQRGQQGVPMDLMWNEVDGLSKLSQYDKENPMEPGVLNAYRELRNAAASDRNVALDKIFTANDAPEAKTWQSYMQSYSKDIGNLSDLQGLFHDPESRQLMVQTLWNSGRGPQQLKVLNQTKAILGESSPEWNFLRGEAVNDLVNKSIGSDGIVSTKALSNMMKGTQQPFLDAIMSREEQGRFQAITARARQISMSDSVLSNSQKETMDATIEVGSHLGMKGLQLAKWAYNLVGGNKAAVDTALSESMLDVARRAGSKSQEQEILTGMRYLDELVTRSKVIEVKRGGVLVKKYLPIAIATSAQATQGPPTATTPQAPPPPDQDGMQPAPAPGQP